MPKVIVSTSNKYLHLIPVFEYLYLKYWGDMNIEIVGYDKPETSLPFFSLGKQGDVSEWSTDLRKYFEKQDQYVIWLFDDTLIKSVDREKLKYAESLAVNNTGRIDLTRDLLKREHLKTNGFALAHPESRYRLSTQPSIWNKEFLLEYLRPGLDPWKFETQDPKNDRWNVLGLLEPAVKHNEGVRKHNIYELDLNGLPDEDIAYLKNHNSWIK